MFQLPGSIADSTVFNAQVAGMSPVKLAPTSPSRSNLESGPSPGFFYEKLSPQLDKKIQSQTQGGPQHYCQLKVKEDLPNLDLDLMNQPLYDFICSAVESNISPKIPQGIVYHPTLLRKGGSVNRVYDEQILDPVHSGGNSGGRGRGVKTHAVDGQIGIPQIPQTETHFFSKRYCALLHFEVLHNSYSNHGREPSWIYAYLERGIGVGGGGFGWTCVVGGGRRTDRRTELSKQPFLPSTLYDT
eukprot:scaffold6108_cov119-Skeletonema_menzelii.AAC.6